MSRRSSSGGIHSVSIPPESRAAVGRVCDEHGITLRAMLGDLIHWFVTLDRTSQSIVLRHTASGLPSDAVAIIRHMQAVHAANRAALNERCLPEPPMAPLAGPQTAVRPEAPQETPRLVRDPL